jgi:hypothetical protein
MGEGRDSFSEYIMSVSLKSRDPLGKFCPDVM